MKQEICKRCVDERAPQTDGAAAQWNHFDDGRWSHGQVTCPRLLTDGMLTMVTTWSPPPVWCAYAVEQVVMDQP